MVALGTWEIGAPAGWIDALFYFYPIEIFKRLWEFIVEGTDEGSIWLYLYYTLTAALIGFFLGSFVGIICGVALGRNRFLSHMCFIYIRVLNAIPRVVLLAEYLMTLVEKRLAKWRPPTADDWHG